MSQLKKFNPYDLPEETLLAIATGRERVLESILATITRNAEGGAVQHLQVVAPRGYGKSFLMRLVQSALKARAAEGKGHPCVVALLPEEQHNVDAPHRLLNEIQRVLENGPAESLLGGAFAESDHAWDEAVAALDSAISACLPDGRGTVVAIVENFDQLMIEVFRNPRDQSRLRALLTRPGGRLMLLATATRRIDASYEQRLFHATGVIELAPWKEESCLAFFERLRGHRQQEPMSPETRAKAQAVAEFIGGSPRMATALAVVLDSNDSLKAAELLDGLVDELTPYYKHRIESLSRRARTLLDALLRMGEPRTQSEIAARLGIAQARIAEPFNELRLRGEVVGVKARKSAEMLYRVGDRLMAHYYRRRHLGASLLEAITEFLMVFYSTEEKHMEVVRLRALGRTLEAALMERLVAADRAPSMGRDLGPDSNDGWLNHLRERVVKLVETGQAAEAVAHCQQAVLRADSSNDQQDQSLSRLYLGWVLGKLGRHAEAVDTLRHAIAIAEKAGALPEQADATCGLGWVLGELGRHAEAVDTLRHAIAIAEKVGALAEQAQATRLLGEVLEKLGRHAEAVDIFRHAIVIAEKARDTAEIALAAVGLMNVALEIEDDATLVMAWQRAVSEAALSPDKERMPDVSLWFDDAAAAALRSGQFGAVWLTTARLTTKDERPLHRAQDRIAETIAGASLEQGRAAAYALAADWIEVLSRNATARASHKGPAGLEPVAFLRGSLPGLAQRVSDPALLRDIAALLEQRLPSQTKAERALLEAAARRAESPDDPTSLERMDPDVVKALERVLGIGAQPDTKPPPRRGKRSGKPRNKK